MDVSREVVEKVAERFKPDKGFSKRLGSRLLSTPHVTIEPWQALAYWTLSFVASPKVIGDRRAGYGLIDWLTKENWEHLLRLILDDGPNPCLAVIDGRVLSFVGVRSSYSIEDDEEVAGPVKHWLTCVTINVRELYTSLLAETKVWTSRQQKSSGTKTPSPRP